MPLAILIGTCTTTPRAHDVSKQNDTLRASYAGARRDLCSVERNRFQSPLNVRHRRLSSNSGDAPAKRKDCTPAKA